MVQISGSGYSTDDPLLITEQGEVQDGHYFIKVTLNSYFLSQNGFSVTKFNKPITVRPYVMFLFQVLENEIFKFEENICDFEEDLNGGSNIPEDVRDSILTVIGMAKLLMAQKLTQFRELCYKNIVSNHVKTTCQLPGAKYQLINYHLNLLGSTNAGLVWQGNVTIKFTCLTWTLKFSSPNIFLFIFIRTSPVMRIPLCRPARTLPASGTWSASRWSKYTGGLTGWSSSGGPAGWWRWVPVCLSDSK